MHVCDYIFLASIILLFIIVICVFLVAGKMSIENSNELVSLAVKKRNVYLRSSIIWLSIFYWLTLSSILSTIIVIYLCAYEKDDSIRIFLYSVLSLFSIIIDFVLSPRVNSIGYRKAFRYIDNILLKTISVDTDSNEIINSINQCEDIIANIHK